MHTMPLAQSRERAERASFLRACGMSWREICQQLGYSSHGAVQLAVQRHRRRNPPPSPQDTFIEIGLRRQHVNATVLRQLAVAAAGGDSNAVANLARTITAADESTARMYGLNAPERHEHLVAAAPADAVARLRGELLDVIDAEVEQ